MADVTVLTEVFDELATRTLNVTFSVPDGAGSTRPPVLAEMTALEMSVSLLDNDYITAWVYGAGTWAAGGEVLKNVNVKNTGRGAYTDATGVLVLTLHAGDMPCVAVGTVPGAMETHELIVTGRYNGDLDQFHARARFTVVNLAKVPRVP